MSEERSSAALDHALAELGDRLKRLKTEVEPPVLKRNDAPATGLGMAFAVAAHMVAGLGVGGGIGYLLDRWLDTSPWMLVLFFFLGAAAGILNTYRVASGMGMAAGYHPAPEQKRTTRDGQQAAGPSGETKEDRGGNSGQSA